MAVKEKFRTNPSMPSEFIGLFGDTKPTKSIQYAGVDVLPLSTYTETDGNGKVIGFYIYDGSAWNAKENVVGAIECGIATGGSKTTIVDSVKNFGTNILSGAIAKVRVNGIEYLRSIASNTADTITIATLPGAAAGAVYGDAGGGQVTIACVEEGEAGNLYTLEVVLSPGQDAALSASLLESVLTVFLGTDAEGLADNAKNTGTLVAAAIGDVPGFDATMTGSGGVVAETENPVLFTGGIDAVPVAAGCEYQIKSAISAI
jgi:hypothetical protein